MAKKLGRLVVFSALAGAVAAGTYYLLQKKQDEPLKDIDSADDFDDFDDDLDDDTEDMTSDSHSTKNRSYVSLDLEGAKEVIGEKVIETIDKTKERLENFNVSEKLDKAKEFVEEKMVTPQAPTDTAQATANAQPAADEEPAPSVSSTYAAEEESSDSEEFFDDTDLTEEDSNNDEQ